jgi:hypothetical protein
MAIMTYLKSGQRRQLNEMLYRIYQPMYELEGTVTFTPSLYKNSPFFFANLKENVNPRKQIAAVPRMAMCNRRGIKTFL